MYTARDRLRSLVRPQNTGGVVNIDLLMCALLAAPLGPPSVLFYTLFPNYIDKGMNTEKNIGHSDVYIGRDVWGDEVLEWK